MVDDLIGLGIYTLQEAALYSGLTPNKLSRWVFGIEQSEPVIDSQLSDERLISFRDLVQAMAINRAREEDVPLQKIREAIKTAKNDYGVEFPLAYEHKLLWYERNLFIDFPNQQIVQVTGRYHGQTAMQIAEPFMKDLHFDTEGLVEQFTPYKKYGRQIILDPKRQFGQPLVGNTGYRADVLADAYEVEQSTDIVASTFNVDVKDIKTAVGYMKSIRKAA